MRDQWKLEWRNNAWSMEIRMTEQCAMKWKLEWRNNARSMEIRMTEQCEWEMVKLEWLIECEQYAINGN